MVPQWRAKQVFITRKKSPPYRREAPGESIYIQAKKSTSPLVKAKHSYKNKFKTNFFNIKY